MPSSARMLLVSNRLPVRVRVDHGRLDLEPTVGGLATGLAGPHRDRGGVWIGWPGDVARLDAAQREELDGRLALARLAAVHLTATEVQRFYEGYSNGVLWPLFHSMPDRMPSESRDWDVYAQVNERFADAVAAAWRPGDVVWVHDYQLLLLPQLLRARIPSARIGLFLHIPFPPSEVLRILPRRAELLRGMLGADLLGFQTFIDQHNFFASILRLLGYEPDLDRVAVGGRDVRVRVCPIGVDYEAFSAPTGDVTLTNDLARSRKPREALLLGVDRLDYTKGIPRRLLAFERLLERHPRWRGRVRMLQIAVPSREGVAAYKELRQRVDELVGRINGEWSTIGWIPVQLIHRGFRDHEVRALYRSADVMVVTPLRDGMNLVAKEFVASRTDERGILVLSEFAGAAAEMTESVLVNPYDIDGVADAFDVALSASEEEQRRRMRTLRARLRSTGIHAWAASFLETLESIPEPVVAPNVTQASWQHLCQEFAHAAGIALLLDYDGTLVPLTGDPSESGPDVPLTALLAELTLLPWTDVHIVSGRDRGTLDAWLGGLPVHLHAEHGAWSRSPGGAWEGIARTLGPWQDVVREAMQMFAARTPGSFVEEKAAALAWHYRRADPEHGALAGQELRHYLRALLANAPVEVMAGSKVVEVRPQGVHKGLAVVRAMAMRPDARLFAFGDDRTDDDLFAALPADARAIAVGDRVMRPTVRVTNVQEARRLLSDLGRSRLGR